MVCATTPSTLALTSPTLELDTFSSTANSCTARATPPCQQAADVKKLHRIGPCCRWKAVVVGNRLGWRHPLGFREEQLQSWPEEEPIVGDEHALEKERISPQQRLHTRWVVQAACRSR